MACTDWKVSITISVSGGMRWSNERINRKRTTPKNRWWRDQGAVVVDGVGAWKEPEIIEQTGMTRRRGGKKVTLKYYKGYEKFGPISILEYGKVAAVSIVYLGDPVAGIGEDRREGGRQMSEIIQIVKGRVWNARGSYIPPSGKYRINFEKVVMTDDIAKAVEMVRQAMANGTDLVIHDIAHRGSFAPDGVILDVEMIRGHVGAVEA